MKISAMLEREDFYSILQETLRTYSTKLGFNPNPVVTECSENGCALYVNPRLNAILPMHPSQAIITYLQTEYHVGGSWTRRMAVNGYLWLATHFVKQCSQRGIQIKYGYDINNLLIYPCNKKIRIFDFGRNIVYTVLKQGFPDNYLQREIEFRQREANDFIPGIIEAGNGFYSERIIQGRPLARINDWNFVENKKNEAYKLILSLTLKAETVNAKEYLKLLATNCEERLQTKHLTIERKQVQAVFDLLINETPAEEIPIVLSHGDFQSGNIWIDDTNDQLVIIDWETVKKRSPFYDLATLFLDMRKDKNFQRLYDNILSGKCVAMREYGNSAKCIGTIVLAEELAYQTEELSSFPSNIGVKEYRQIIEQYIHLNL